MVGAQQPLVVYVVDDDVGVREGLGRLMRSAGFRFESCESVEDLLSRPGRPPAGCVLLDLSAGRISARSVAARLRAKGLPLPMIALTGDERDGAVAAARAMGAKLLFRKPVDGRALLDAIEWVTHNEINQGSRTR